MGSESPRKRQSAAARRRALEKHPTVKLIRRRGIGPIAYLIEAAWNLREWLREVDEDHTLQPVLTGSLPKIRRRIELSLLDAELSRFAPNLRTSRSATAASLIAFIEGLELPGGLRILAPPGKPPLQWASLARLRALKIAMQLYHADGSRVYDYNSESDLDAIEKLDEPILLRFWNAAERVTPLRQLEEFEPELEPRDPQGTQSELKPKEQAALKLIREEGPIGGKTLALRLDLAESTIRRHIIPRLKGLGVQNDGHGYYVAPRSAT